MLFRSQHDEFTMAERFSALPRVIPFVLLLTGVMIALYGGFATPSETAKGAVPGGSGALRTGRSRRRGAASAVAPRAPSPR